MSRHHSKGERRELARAWVRGGSSATAFAAEHGITVATLRRWKAEGRGVAGGAAGASTALRFVRLTTAATELPPRRGVVVEVSGARVHVEVDTDAELLAMVVSTLKRVT